MSRLNVNETGAKPWSPSSPAEVIFDGLTFGWTRKMRAGRVLSHYATLDSYRSRVGELARNVTPQLLSDLAPGAEAERIARLALEVACGAETIYLETFQGYGATSTRGADGSRRADTHFSGYQHEPTLYRIREATGKDYNRDLRSAHALVALVTRNDSSVDIEGMGCMANEYGSRDAKTGRTTDATFLIQGLAPHTAEQFVSSLREYPAETLDGVIYTAFAGTELPGRSLLQTPLADQPASSLFIPGVCSRVTVATVPGQ